MGKAGGRELNYVSDVDVIFVAEPGEELRWPRPRHWPAHDADLPGSGLGGRRRAATRGPRRPAGAHARQPRGVLQAVGEHLGVPGPAQGPAGRRRSRARRALHRRHRARSSGPRPNARTSWPTCRRCAGARSPTFRAMCAARDQARVGRPARRRVRDPAAAARARPRRRLAARRRRRCRRWPRCTRAAMWAATTRSASPTPTGSCGPPSTACSCAGCAARTSCPKTLTSWRCSPAAWAFGRTRGGATAVFEAEWALHAREVRRLHEKLFYRPLLDAVARVPVRGAPADPR